MYISVSLLFIVTLTNLFNHAFITLLKESAQIFSPWITVAPPDYLCASRAHHSALL